MTVHTGRLTWLVGLLVALVLLVGASGPAAAGPGQATLTVTRTTVNATWKESFLLKGRSIRIGGSVTEPALLRAFIRRSSGGATLVSKDFSVGAGAFNESLPLPPRPLPGAYTLRVLGTAGGAQLAPVDRVVRIPAPATGIVDQAIASATPRGARARSVSGPRNALYCRFHFAYPPKAKKIRVVWRTPSFRFVGETLDTSSTIKPYAPWVYTRVRSAGAPLTEGRWWCYMQTLSRTVAKRSEPIRIR